MKKFAIILLVLILIGAALSYRFLTQEEKLDQTVFLQTTESIRNLQTLDKNLRLLLNQSRLNPEFDHQQLSELNYQISEEFDNLRFDALFEEIEGSPELSQAINAFEARFASREETLDAYIQNNLAITRGLVSVQALYDALQQDQWVKAQPDLDASLAMNKTALFSLALGGKLESDLAIIESNPEAPENIKPQLNNYQTAVGVIVQLHEPTQALFSELNQLDTGALLDSIEDRYVSYHNQAIEGSNALRNALIAYGSALLIALLFFAYQIRKNYLSLEQEVADRTEEIKSAYEELQESQEQLIQSEKMASLGQMVAGVAHEINTPLGYVSSNIDTLKLNLDDLSNVIQDLNTLMTTVQAPNRDNRLITETLITTLKTYKDVDAAELVDESNQLLGDGAYGLSEISKLVTSLKDFARLDRQKTEQINLHDCLESSLTIASNHIRENNVAVVRDFNELPKIACNPSKVNQLFLNIITNACQSMSDSGGDLTVGSSQVGGEIKISFQDQGIGMDEETQQKMFDPFFTSKDIGVGTGLGMSIAYKIVQAHNGRIEVNSSIGQGTTISVFFPTA